MPDIFQRGAQQIKPPVTADKCTIMIDGEVMADAIQFQASYSQSITTRRSIGNKTAIIYGSMPRGQITIARLITESSQGLLGSAIFTCKGGEISFTGGGCEGATGIRYKFKGAMVSNFNVSASADDLTVIDNITIDFIEMSND